MVNSSKIADAMLAESGARLASPDVHQATIDIQADLLRAKDAEIARLNSALRLVQKDLGGEYIAAARKEAVSDLHAAVPEALQLLSDVFDAWENGDACYEGGDYDGSYLGMAFRLDDDVFKRCCDLLNRTNPPRNAAPIVSPTESEIIIETAYGPINALTDNGFDVNVQPVASLQEQAQTDLSKRLRETAKTPAAKMHLYSQIMCQAADEIDRYYNGMLAWKKTAEKKDADYREEVTRAVDARCAARAAQSQAVIAPVTPRHVEEIKDILLWPVTEDDARTARDMLQSLHFDLSMAEDATPPAPPAPLMTDADIAGLYHASQGQPLREQDADRVRKMARAVEHFLVASPTAGSVELPGDWGLEYDKWSLPGTIRLNSPKWGGCFLTEPKPSDIALPALIYRLLADMLERPATASVEQARDGA